jgi:cardiolipin synthase
MDRQQVSDTLHDITGTVRVIVQPEDGVAPVLELIAAAERSVHIKQFTFTHPALLEATIAAHRAGRDVRVMLNAARSSGDRANDDAFAQLHAAGVQVQWSSPNFAVTHEKSMVVDDRLALIATFNFCEKYFSQTRDYGLVSKIQPSSAKFAAASWLIGSTRRSDRPRRAPCCGAI